MRRTKGELYEEERKSIIERLLLKLCINENNRLILVSEIYELKDSIEELIPEIRKSCNCKEWIYFKRGGDILSLVKSLLKSGSIRYNIAYIMDERNKSVKIKGIYFPRS